MPDKDVSINDVMDKASSEETEKAEEKEIQGIEKIKGRNDFIDVLLSETGEGSIENYIEHPFNPFESEGLAQTLRGLTGFFGNLELALVDIMVGGFRFFKEKQE